MTTDPLTTVTDADLVAAVVAGCPSVIALHGGRWGEVATYLPGRQVTGVRVRPDLVEVHVVGRYPVPVPDIARQIRTALQTSPVTAVAGTLVEVVVEDYAEPASERRNGPAPASPEPGRPGGDDQPSRLAGA